MIKLHLQPQISLIICTFERYPQLARAIASLRSQALADGALEILVIDNSRDQKRADICAESYCGVENLRYIHTPETGLSRARNLGLAQAQAGIVAFLDDDAVAAPGWAQALLNGFTKFGPRAGAVGGPVMPIWPGQRPAWLSDDLLFFLGLINWGTQSHQVLPGRGLVGCNMALDRDLTLSLGGFPVELGRNGPGDILLSNEESALFTQIEKAGRTIIYEPAAGVQHSMDAARLTQEWFLRRSAWQAVSDYMMNPQQHSLNAESSARFVAAEPAGGEHEAAFNAKVWMTYYAVLTALSGGAMPLAPSPFLARQLRRSALKGALFARTQNLPAIAGLARAGLQAFRRGMGKA